MKKEKSPGLFRKSGFFTAIYIVVYTAFVIATCCLFHAVYEVQKTPFLDEIFHVPQAQKYCAWLFKEWDSKITTLPGLYLLSIGALVPLETVFQRGMCEIYFLRLINLIACLVNFYIIHEIQRRLHSCKKEMLLLSTINITMFPVLYFFSFLYYTDTISTTMVLLMYLLHLENQDFLSASVGLIAVIIRQTNIIWVFFVFLETVIDVLKTEAITSKKRVTASHQKCAKFIQILRFTIIHCWEEGIMSCIILCINILLRGGCFIIVILLFSGFVVINGGLVLGDKAAHEPVIHIPQLLYFSFFTSVFAFPFLVFHLKSFLSYCNSHKKFVFILIIALIVIISSNTLVHPYLLADNRHYSFYIWKRLYERHELIRYALIPLYVFAMYSMLKVLNHASITFRIFYLSCVALCLVPQKLLEFRYFIIPYLLFRLQIPQLTWLPVILESLLYTAINVATFYLFFTYTFLWPDFPEVQRILW